MPDPTLITWIIRWYTSWHPKSTENRTSQRICRLSPILRESLSRIQTHFLWAKIDVCAIFLNVVYRKAKAKALALIGEGDSIPLRSKACKPNQCWSSCIIAWIAHHRTSHSKQCLRSSRLALQQKDVNVEKIHASCMKWSSHSPCFKKRIPWTHPSDLSEH